MKMFDFEKSKSCYSLGWRMAVVELYIIKFKTVNFVPLVSCVSKDCKQLNLISLIPFDFCFREVLTAKFGTCRGRPV